MMPAVAVLDRRIMKMATYETLEVHSAPSVFVLVHVERAIRDIMSRRRRRWHAAPSARDTKRCVVLGIPLDIRMTMRAISYCGRIEKS